MSTLKALKQMAKDVGRQPGEKTSDFVKDFLPNPSELGQAVKSGAKKLKDMITNPVQTANKKLDKKD